MQCKNHPDEVAEYFCTNCHAPLCSQCVEEVRPGVYACFQCAMLLSVSKGESTLADKRERTTRDRSKKKIKWGPFHYFLVVSSLLIVVMWAVIIFGGRSSPQRTSTFSKNSRVLLFMVQGALKRYAHYEGNKYPERLSELVPRYLSLRESELSHLNRLSYTRSPEDGYRLSLSRPEKGEMNVILLPKGIQYAASKDEGA